MYIFLYALHSYMKSTILHIDKPLCSDFSLNSMLRSLYRDFPCFVVVVVPSHIVLHCVAILCSLNKSHVYRHISPIYGHLGCFQYFALTKNSEITLFLCTFPLLQGIIQVDP